MADSSALTRLQLDLLEGLGSVDGAFLSGGSCLAFGYFGHRRSYDLDFFCADAETVTEVAGRLAALCAEQNWTLQSERAWPGFRRFQVAHGDEATIVDIVHDTAEQLVPVPQKPEIDGIRIDDLRDLLANKLCAALGRSEVKDLVDLFAMEAHGLDLLAAISDAERKDGGMDPATLAWVLRDAPTDTSRLLLLRPIDEHELRVFRDRLVERLAAAAWPDAPSDESLPP